MTITNLAEGMIMKRNGFGHNLRPLGSVMRWMTYPAQAYSYLRRGDLTIQSADREEKTIHAGRVALQPRAAWYDGRNEEQCPFRCLAVFFGAKSIPDILTLRAARRLLSELNSVYC